MNNLTMLSKDDLKAIREATSIRFEGKNIICDREIDSNKYKHETTILKDKIDIDFIYILHKNNDRFGTVNNILKLIKAGDSITIKYSKGNIGLMVKNGLDNVNIFIEIVRKGKYIHYLLENIIINTRDKQFINLIYSIKGIY